MITKFLALGKRLAGKRRLVDGHVDSFRETAIGGNDVTNLEGHHVTRNKLGRFDLEPFAFTLDLGLGRERVHECLDGIASTAFLVEADSRVDEQQEDNTNEILPIRRHTLTVREGNGDESSTLHDPGQRVPHETQELHRENIGQRHLIFTLEHKSTNLKEGVLILLLKLVRTENIETTLGFLVGETVVSALKQLEDIVDDDGLEVDFFLVIQVLRLKLDLNLGVNAIKRNGPGKVFHRKRTYRGHVDIGI